MIYTGYYAKLKKYTEDGLIPISIAMKTPKFYTGTEFKALAPTWNIFSKWKSGEISNDQYIELFKKEVLDKLNKVQIKNFLNSFKDDIILLCYEKSSDFCHRHIVGQWISNEFNIEVQEYPI